MPRATGEDRPEPSNAGQRRTRRANGEGSFVRREDNRVELKVSVTLSDGSRKRVSVYGKDKAEALRKKKELLGKTEKGIDRSAERQSLAAFLATWLDDVCAPKLRPKTMRAYRYNVDRHIVPALGSRKLRELTPAMVQRFLNQLSASGLSPRTVGQARAVLRAALNVAKAWGYVEANAAEPVNPPRIKRSPARSLTHDDARTLLDYAAEDRIGPLLVVALNTGLRQGELLGLRWPDVDLDAGTLLVRNQAQKVKGADGRNEWRLVEPKSDAARRVIPLTPEAVAALRIQKDRVRELRMLAGNRWTAWGLVFPSSVGTPQDGPNVTNRLRVVLDKAGLPACTFHELRHSCATFLAAAGVHPKVMQALLGHTSANLTLTTYAHVLPTMLDDARDALDRTLGARAIR